VHGHHYALVVLEGLPAGSETPYSVQLDRAPSNDQNLWMVLGEVT